MARDPYFLTKPSVLQKGYQPPEPAYSAQNTLSLTVRLIEPKKRGNSTEIYLYKKS